jgi:hypothetical protein
VAVKDLSIPRDATMYKKFRAVGTGLPAIFLTLGILEKSNLLRGEPFGQLAAKWRHSLWVVLHELDAYRIGPLLGNVIGTLQIQLPSLDAACSFSSKVSKEGEGTFYIYLDCTILLSLLSCL